MKPLKIVIFTTKYLKEVKKLIDNQEIFLFTNKRELDLIKIISPDYVFFLHWHWKVPEEIYNRYTCIQFHISDLPKYRGGSPLQNQIMAGIKYTKITAFRMTGEIDAGDIYLQRKINISKGSADKIFKRSLKKSFSMIAEIISGIKPYPQSILLPPLKRRTTTETISAKTLKQFYDQIRMVDGEGYPRAYIRHDNFKIEFTNAKINDYVTGTFRITNIGDCSTPG